MSKTYQNIQLLANVLIIVVAILIAGVFVQRYIFPYISTSSKRVIPKVGESVIVTDVDWSKSNKNVLLVLQKGCDFCTASAEFYQKLIEQTKDRGVNIVAFFPQTKEEAEKYLSELGISGIEVRQSQLDSLFVTGTPTIIVANEKGQITDVWVGKLPPEKETEVLAKLKS